MSDSDIVAFIRARLDDDEEAARYSDEHMPGASATDPNSANMDPARVLRGVEADRAILEMFETAQLSVEVADGTPLAGATRLKAKTLRRVLVARSAQWSDHPDYDQSWSVTA